MIMKLERGITVSACAVSGELATGKISNILTNVVIVEAGVKHYVVTKKVLKEQGYIIEEPEEELAKDYKDYIVAI
ncbi:hypothetical protein RV05_GL000826 [Enterococcus hirae]|nr:hypothetical protein RV05_GL000826 [Enterococcus hirae]